jgi:hypothetical protein
VNRSDFDDLDGYVFTVSSESQTSSISVTIGGVPTNMIIDSGASCNLINRNEWERLKIEKVKCESKKCTRKCYAYGSKVALYVAGSFTAEVSIGMSTEVAEFIVAEGQGQNLRGKDTAVKLNALRLGPDDLNKISESDLQEQCKEVFTGLGKLKDFSCKFQLINQLNQ